MQFLFSSFILFYQFLSVAGNDGRLTTEENTELQKNCGHYSASFPGPQTKSYGGEPSRRSEAPWAVAMALFIEDGSGSNRSFTTRHCSATLISDRHVLTAWHCLVGGVQEIELYRPITLLEIDDRNETKDSCQSEYEPVKIQFGGDITFDKYRFVLDDDCSADHTPSSCSIKNATIRKAIKAISPKQIARNLKQGHMDVAILELDEPVDFRHDLYPACLSEIRPKNEDVLGLFAFGDDYIMDNTTLGGTLQKIQVASIPCYKHTGLDEVCLLASKKGVLGGDSGGGFIYKKNERAYVTVVVSGKVEIIEGLLYEPHHTAIAHHLHWICTHTGVCIDETKAEQIHTFVETITPYL